MNTDRRSFLGGLLAASAAAKGAAANAAESAARPRGKVKLRFGVMTDTHIGTSWMAGINTPAVEKALRWFDSRGADAVVACGDQVNSGTVEQLRALGEIWNKVFPGGRGSDGRPVEKVFVNGNHEVALWYKPEKQAEKPDYFLLPQMAKWWQECLGEKFEPVYVKRIKGFPFVGINWSYDKPEFVQPALERALKGVKKGEPVFCAIHNPVAATCYSSAPKPNALTKLFEGVSNAVVFSGHTHKPVTHPRSIWQGAFTAINSGVVTWIEVPPAVWPKPLPPGAPYAKNLLFATVYDKSITIERYDLVREAPIGREWEFPLPLDPATFRYTDAYFAALPKARFPEGTSATANQSMGDRSLGPVPVKWDYWKDDPGGMLVSFPAAGAGGENLVVRYDIKVVRADNGETVLTREVPTDFYFGIKRMKRTYDVIIPAAELPAEVPCRYEVTAIDSMGRADATLATEPVAWHKYNAEVY